ncbi:hypothetical protein HAZT_HAZT003742 [Hyalella azteca]|uniref:Ig-like domain-containing protein n=1 Tax=Hyalella azteca TaxID=294128 RepID=A0A6A0GZ35_HYAAZ|nr:hypothetical protein HAZT_HAZT003742 [Hyalella azteca]
MFDPPECQQKQHFRKRPSDLQVKQGSTAVLKCEVGNQGGRVQWAKDGFVLVGKGRLRTSGYGWLRDYR